VSATWLTDATRESPWADLTVLVAGLRRAGFACADALSGLGAEVVAVDASEGSVQREHASVLEILGARVVLGQGHDDRALLDGVDLVVASPGWRPDAPLLQAATARGVPVWSDVELAWRVQRTQDPPAWLTVTGTNGKTTTVEMLAAILAADGRRSAAVGNVGTPVVEAVAGDAGLEVLAVELSSFQLARTSSVRPTASALINIASDHLDWHGGFDAYVAAKARVYANTQTAIIYSAMDPITEQLARDAEVEEGCRGIGVTLGIPDVGMLGVVDGVLVDRAFVAERQTHAAELAEVGDLVPAGPHNVIDALVAAALARAYGVAPRAVRDGLRMFRPAQHRIAEVATVAGVRYVDDSKATNPHAARASLLTFDDVVWIAGGLAKGAEFDDLVRDVKDHLRAAVLIGTDRALLRDALARHAPDVPVMEPEADDTEVMTPADGAAVMAAAVRAAAEVAARSGGATVLLAPACASMDQFADYAARGDAFAAAVQRLPR
jgi:UDP-N-acetylmuramoylalanine--D-glutamate ligase